MRIRNDVFVSTMIALAAVVPIACQEQQAEQPPLPEQIEPPSPLRTGWEGGCSLQIGESIYEGKVTKGPFKLDLYDWHNDRNWLSLGVAGFPGKSFGPAFLIVARLQAESKPDSLISASGANVFAAEYEFDSGRKGRAAVVWKLLEDDFRQTMHIAGTEYDLKHGRVFLVDATAKAVSVHQIAADLGGTFNSPGPDLDKLADEIEALRKSDVKVKRFWSGSHPDIEEN